ncbi:MAG: anaerobic glycerol-3-phosphate dehydrogenase subunit A [Desulfotignum sp.]|nr:anaerobic glycerol-3-phosphate dehydrogenase subunit A [Desulfotignum sp.]MCF8137868.1 anaerobic glycerol-3-phosphate dehydrogenase subunit A [Desulfotignum sp.]
METQALIIGGGTTGTGIARDLALRGISCILIDKKDINAGASGANHGLLHSGARYILKDSETAVECRQESLLLKRLAPHCMEDTGGLFVALPEDDDTYIARFPELCRTCGIDCQPVDAAQALHMEPCLAPDVKAVFAVRDAVVDPFSLSLDNAADAQANGTRILRNARVEGFISHKGRIQAARIRDTRTGDTFQIEACQYINATGAWADKVAAMAGAHISMLYSKGSLLITQSRINTRVINRLRPAADADILVPGGTVSIIGTTSLEIDNLDDIRPTMDEVDTIIQQGAVMVPALATTRYIRAYAGVRPLVKNGGDAGRAVSRNYTLKDHESEGLENFVTITGGKLTTYRLMAEKTADIVARRLNNRHPCRTADLPLPSSSKGAWTEPGKAPRSRAARAQSPGPSSGNTLICECEMVSESMVDRIVDSLKAEGRPPALTEVGQRSRIGKGPCQGTFCSFRLAAYLYRTGDLSGDQGLSQIREFVNERWKGLMPLVRDRELVRMELQESFLCGLFNMDADGWTPNP